MGRMPVKVMKQFTALKDRKPIVNNNYKVFYGQQMQCNPTNYNLWRLELARSISILYTLIINYETTIYSSNNPKVGNPIMWKQIEEMKTVKPSQMSKDMSEWSFSANIH